MKRRKFICGAVACVAAGLLNGAGFADAGDVTRIPAYRELWRKHLDEGAREFAASQERDTLGACRLYLAYTRVTPTNGHVFRNRAPVFPAEFDPSRGELVRETEIPLVPERGARLGNFCCTEDGHGGSWLVTAEWMQPIGCEKYGSDNSICFVKVSERPAAKRNRGVLERILSKAHALGIEVIGLNLRGCGREAGTVNGAVSSGAEESGGDLFIGVFEGRALCRALDTAGRSPSETRGAAFASAFRPNATDGLNHLIHRSAHPTFL